MLSAPAVVNRFFDILLIGLHCPPLLAVMPLVGNVVLITPHRVVRDSRHPSHCSNPWPSANRALFRLTLYLSSISEPPVHRTVPCCALFMVMS